MSDKVSMHVALLRKILIMFRLFWVSMTDTSWVVIGSFFVKNKWLYASRIVHSWALKVLRIMRVQYKVLNPTHFKFLKGRPYIIMSNHISHFDIPLIYTAFPNDIVGMIAKKELFRIPIFGRGMRISGCVSIDRENKRRALEDLVTAKENILSGVRLWVAPEGTRSRTGKMGVFKKGGFKIAMDTKATIVPVTIIGSNNILPAKTFDFSLDEKVEVHIGKPIDTTRYQAGDLKKLMQDTLDEIASNGS